ncbi:MAG: hypothetical protein KAJ29_00065 [Alphaproteobacteria bacterium]|nr:hypothetical protein [Alphaproteobacteria bacterium]
MFIWSKHKKETGEQGDQRKPGGRTFRRFVSTLLVISLLFGSALTVKPEPVYAALCIPCAGCTPGDLVLTLAGLVILNLIWEPIIVDDITYIINLEYEFLNETFFEDFWIKAMAELTEYLSAYGLYQAEMVGSFFDAKNQLETSRLIFKLQAEAHRDYHPSDDFCWIGTNARSLASSESLSRLNMLAMSKIAMDRQLGKQNTSSGHDDIGDPTGRWHQFVDTFCDEKDNAWDEPDSGLERACDHDGSGVGVILGANDRSKVNIDLDYTRLIEIPRTLEINFTDATIPPAVPVPSTLDEEAILAMSSNLYGNVISSRTINYDKMHDYTAARSLYLDQRAVTTRRGIAQNSFNAIVSMKSSGTSSATTGADTASFMAAILQELMPVGTPDDEIFEVLGENPSYYAQLEMLSKKIYENPKFFAKLYDTPANVARKGVAMKAIELMIDRALFESELRQEMLLSVMLSTELDQKFRRVNKGMTGKDD